MSVDYAAGLSDYDDLGVCGLDEVYDKVQDVEEKVSKLAGLIRHHKGSCVVHVGAGLSTAAGIPDFRGKRGVWTKKLLETTKGQVGNDDSLQKGALNIKSEADKNHGVTDEVKYKPFDQTEPTLGHMVLVELCRQGFISHIISQNVDGLFLKANLAKEYISELHGNFYLDECTRCRSRFIRAEASTSMRLTRSTIKCPKSDSSAQCKGYLRDTILDWESPIPYNELRVAQREAKRNKLHLCIGTSMQLRPSKDLVCNPQKSKQNRLVVINLQPTQLDTKANLVINYFADTVLCKLAEELNLIVDPYDSCKDPTKCSNLVGTVWRRQKST